MIQGSNQVRTARRAIGQEICGRTPFSSQTLPIFFPRSRCISRNPPLWGRFRLSCRLRLGTRLRGAVRGVIPTEGESTTDQLPVPSNRLVAPDLILGPAQSV